MSFGIPEDSDARKLIPLTTGVIDYFTAALAEVAKVSYYGNLKHNGNAPLHWSRGKSADQADCIARHLAERGTTYEFTFTDSEGNLQTVHLRHSAGLAWRSLALLQEELETTAGAEVSRASVFTASVPAPPSELPSDPEPEWWDYDDPKEDAKP